MLTEPHHQLLRLGSIEPDRRASGRLHGDLAEDVDDELVRHAAEGTVPRIGGGSTRSPVGASNGHSARSSKLIDGGHLAGRQADRADPTAERLEDEVVVAGTQHRAAAHERTVDHHADAAPAATGERYQGGQFSGIVDPDRQEQRRFPRLAAVGSAAQRVRGDGAAGRHGDAADGVGHRRGGRRRASRATRRWDFRVAPRARARP